MMLLKAKDLTLGRSESIYEILYLIIGRKSIFMYCGSLLVTMIGAMVAYYSIFGDILSHLLTQMLIGENTVS